MTRAAVKTIAGFSGINPPKDVIDLQLDKDEIHVGSDVTGRLRILGNAPVKSVHLTLEGIEYSVVALPLPEDFYKNVNTDIVMQYLKKHTTEKRTLIKQEILLDCAKPQIFRFPLAEHLPCTMRCRLDESNSMLPSQCQVIYTISAMMYGKSSKSHICHNVVVLPKERPISPLDPCITISMSSILDFFLKNMFACGETFCKVNDHPDGEISNSDRKIILLEPNPSFLQLMGGQQIKVDVQDWLGLLINPNTVWMIRLVERLSWTANGHVASFRQSWDFDANHHQLPTTLRRTYDQDPKSLLKVFHEIVIYAKKKDAPKEIILASTEPISIQIV